MDCDCLTPITSLEGGWMSFNSTDLKFTVLTLENKNVGNYTIVLVRSFDDYPGVNPYSRFTLAVHPYSLIDSSIIRKPPYFEPVLTTQ
jgi:hypothetical protein